MEPRKMGSSNGSCENGSETSVLIKGKEIS
jgi:hypothetical protein